jgi:hypothetical protein
MDDVIVQFIDETDTIEVTFSETGLVGGPGLTGPAGTFTGNETLVDLGTRTGAVTIDLTTGSAFKMVLTGNVVITFTNAPANKVSYASLRLTQDSSGTARTVSIVGSQAAYGVKPSLSTLPNAVDKMICETWDGGSTWDVAITGQQMSATP